MVLQIKAMLRSIFCCLKIIPALLLNKHKEMSSPKPWPLSARTHTHTHNRKRKKENLAEINQLFWSISLQIHFVWVNNLTTVGYSNKTYNYQIYSAILHKIRKSITSTVKWIQKYFFASYWNLWGFFRASVETWPSLNATYFHHTTPNDILK